MRKVHFMRIVGALALCLLIILAFKAYHRLPDPSASRLSGFYEGFSGVIRVWACEGWQPGTGSLSQWLNAAAASFEKSHDGVYIQITYVSEETLRAFNHAAENPPDMLIFSPGMLSGPDDLLALSTSEALRRELIDKGDGYAIPIACGHYAWAINTSLSDTLSESTMAIPVDQQRTGYSAALAALLTGNIASDTGQRTTENRYGTDLGLPVDEAAPEPENTVDTAREEIIPGADSIQTPDAYRMFTGKQAHATIVTQRELMRLQTLSDAGRAPDYAIMHTGELFTDQIAYISIVNLPKSDLSERQKISRAYIDFLLTDAIQSRLTSVKAFPTANIPPIYTSTPGFREMEDAAANLKMNAVEAFPKKLFRLTEDQVQSLLSGNGGASNYFSDLMKAP